jgi:hypothetical protein
VVPSTALELSCCSHLHQPFAGRAYINPVKLRAQPVVEIRAIQSEQGGGFDRKRGDQNRPVFGFIEDYLETAARWHRGKDPLLTLRQFLEGSHRCFVFFDPTDHPRRGARRAGWFPLSQTL